MDVFDLFAFLSTLPVRGATHCSYRAAMYCKFLSTLPVRGATGLKLQSRRKNKISIHAPREGSDLTVSYDLLTDALFLSTLPVRGATEALPAPSDGGGNFYPRSP